MPESSWDHLVEAHRQVGAENDPVLKHEPKAAILACSDARVPPSVLFHQPAGNLFVVRIAGNTAVPSAVASLDYAVAKLDVDLVIVLGHSNCGAVAAAAAGTCGGHLAPVVASICAIADANPGLDPDRIAELNVASTMSELFDHHGPVGEAARSGHVEIRGALHHLDTGVLQTILPARPHLIPTP